MVGTSRDYVTTCYIQQSTAGFVLLFFLQFLWQCCARYCNDDTVITAMPAVVCVAVLCICDVFQMLASCLEPGLASMSMEMVQSDDDDGNDD